MTDYPKIKLSEITVEDRLREVDPNWVEARTDEIARNELTAFDRAHNLFELKAVYERLHPETKAGVAGGKARQGSATDILSFADDTAEKIGLSERHIRRSIKLWKGLTGDSKQRLRGTWLADHQANLRLLSEQKPPVQKKVLDILFAEKPKATSVTDALLLIALVHVTGCHELLGFVCEFSGFIAVPERYGEIIELWLAEVWSMNAPVTRLMKEWFSCQELADLAIAKNWKGVPRTKYGWQKHSKRENWRSDHLCRKRQGYGGGLEFHFSLLPEHLHTCFQGDELRKTNALQQHKPDARQIVRRKGLELASLSRRQREVMAVRRFPEALCFTGSSCGMIVLVRMADMMKLCLHPGMHGR